MQEILQVNYRSLATTGDAVKRILAVMLALALTVGLLPATAQKAYAAPDAPTNVTIRNGYLAAGSTNADAANPVVNTLIPGTLGGSATDDSYVITYGSAPTNYPGGWGTPPNQIAGNDVANTYTKAIVTRPGDSSPTPIATIPLNKRTGYPISGTAIDAAYLFGAAGEGVYTYQVATAVVAPGTAIGSIPADEWSAWSAPVTLTYDTTAPAISDVTVVRSTANTKDKFDVIGTVTDANLASYSFRLYNAAATGPYAEVTSGWSAEYTPSFPAVTNGRLGTIQLNLGLAAGTGIPAGKYYLRVVATDRADNANDTATLVDFTVGSKFSGTKYTINTNSGPNVQETLDVFDNDFFVRIDLLSITTPDSVSHPVGATLPRYDSANPTVPYFYSYVLNTATGVGTFTFDAANLEAQLDAGDLAPGIYKFEVITARGKFPYELTVVTDTPRLSAYSATLDFTGTTPPADVVETLTLNAADTFLEIDRVGLTTPDGLYDPTVSTLVEGDLYSYVLNPTTRIGTITLDAAKIKAALEADQIAPGVYDLRVKTAFNPHGINYTLTIIATTAVLYNDTGSIDVDGSSDLVEPLTLTGQNEFVRIDRVGFTYPDGTTDNQTIDLSSYGVGANAFYAYDDVYGNLILNRAALKTALERGDLAPGIYNLKIITTFAELDYTLTVIDNTPRLSDYDASKDFGDLRTTASTRPGSWSETLTINAFDKFAGIKIVAFKDKAGATVAQNIDFAPYYSYSATTKTTGVITFDEAKIKAALDASDLLSGIYNLEVATNFGKVYYTLDIDYKYTIYFDAGVDGVSDEPVRYGVPYGTELLVVPSAERPGYIFLGWFVDSSNPATHVVVDPLNPIFTTKNTTYKAGWVLDTSTLDGAKANAEALLDGYAKASDYRTAEQAQLSAAITAGKAAINGATTTADVLTAFNNAKAAIDAIKTDAQYVAEEAAAAAALLAAEKTTAINNLATYKNASAYRAAEQAALAAEVAKGNLAINNAASVAAVQAALVNARTAIDALNLKTAAQYAAEEAAAAAAALAADKTTAINNLAGYKDASDYRSAEQGQLSAAITAGNTAINNATTPGAVATALANAKAAIDALKLKTDAQYKAEEAAAKADADAAALQAAKDSAKSELNGYAKLTDYRSAEQIALTNEKIDAQNNIDSAKTTTAIAAALATYKAAIDKLKTDAQYKADEAAALAAASANVVNSVKSLNTAVKTVYIQKGKSLKIPYVVYASGSATGKVKVAWTANKAKIVSVAGAKASAKKGSVNSGKLGAKSTLKVTGKKAGTTTISLKAGGKTLKIKVKVLSSKKAVASFKATAAKSLKAGASKVIKITKITSNGTGNIATFSIAGKYAKYLKVDAAGKLTALKAYNTSVPVKVKVGSKTKTIKVKVK